MDKEGLIAPLRVAVVMSFGLRVLILSSWPKWVTCMGHGLKNHFFFLSFFCLLRFPLFSSRLLVACTDAGHNTHIAHVDVSRPPTSEKLFESFIFTGCLLSIL